MLCYWLTGQYGLVKKKKECQADAVDSSASTSAAAASSRHKYYGPPLSYNLEAETIPRPVLCFRAAMLFCSLSFLSPSPFWR